MKEVPVGRYDIQISYMGYNTHIVNEVLVTSSKRNTIGYIVERKHSSSQ